MLFQNNPIAPLKTGFFQNATWSIESQCPFFGQIECSSIESISGTDALSECVKRIFLGSQVESSLELFSSCFCDKERYNVEDIVSHFNIIPTFAEPKSDVAQLIEAIFKGDVKQAKKLLEKDSFAFEKNLDSNFIAALASELGEFQILQLFLQSQLSAGSYLGLEFRSNVETKNNIEKMVKNALDPSNQSQIAIAKCIRLASKSKHKAALWVAILNGDVEQVKNIVKTARIDLNSGLNSQNVMPLQLAIKLGNKDLFNALMELKAEPNAKGSDGRDYLNLALDLKRLDMAKELVKQGARLKRIDEYHFHNFIDLDTLDCFCELGGDIQKLPFDKLFQSLKGPNEKILMYVDKYSIENPLVGSAFYRIMISRAYHANNFELAREFIQRAVSANSKFLENNHLVNQAYNYADFETFKFVLNLPNANINERDAFAKMPLLHHLSTYISSPNIPGILDYNKKLVFVLNHPGLDVNAQDISNSTALHYVVQLQKEKLFKRLLDLGASVDIEDQEGKKPQDFDETKEQSYKQEIERRILIKEQELERKRLDEERERQRIENKRIKLERLRKEALEREELIKKIVSWAISGGALAAILFFLAIHQRSKKNVDKAEKINLDSLNAFDNLNLETSNSEDLELLETLKSSPDEEVTVSEAVDLGTFGLSDRL